MKMKIHLVVMFLVLGCAEAPSAAEPLIQYERTHSQVAHEDNTYSLTVYDDGTVEAHFPRHSPQAGTYRWTLPPEEIRNLLDLVAPIGDIESESLLTSIQTTRSQGLIEVADTDRVVLEINDATRGQNQIVVPSPEIWQKHLPEGHDMGTVATIAKELAAWMRDQARERAQ
ncbi:MULTISPECIES: hypothetical protein [unclassified Wenzhouxiangella]|uniref:hypothetical protein n=1 Tax=unclassified Wenzhouxiangella TaxID=2613841 RepID=UPI0011C04DC6|nr:MULTISPECIES: hypothetical protein [unclassified Wenzhouxiangella]